MNSGRLKNVNKANPFFVHFGNVFTTVFVGLFRDFGICALIIGEDCKNNRVKT